MRFGKLPHDRFPLLVERGKRLIEQPEGSCAQDKTGQREAPPQAGGKILDREFAQMGKTRTRQRVIDIVLALIKARMGS